MFYYTFFILAHFQLTATHFAIVLHILHFVLFSTLRVNVSLHIFYHASRKCFVTRFLFSLIFSLQLHTSLQYYIYCIISCFYNASHKCFVTRFLFSPIFGLPLHISLLFYSYCILYNLYHA